MVINSHARSTLQLTTRLLSTQRPQTSSSLHYYIYSNLPLTTQLLSTQRTQTSSTLQHETYSNCLWFSLIQVYKYHTLTLVRNCDASSMYNCAHRNDAPQAKHAMSVGTYPCRQTLNGTIASAPCVVRALLPCVRTDHDFACVGFCSQPRHLSGSLAASDLYVVGCAFVVCHDDDFVCFDRHANSAVCIHLDCDVCALFVWRTGDARRCA